MVRRELGLAHKEHDNTLNFRFFLTISQVKLDGSPMLLLKQILVIKHIAKTIIMQEVIVFS